MALITPTILNAILCEDVRSEMGNKKSLMGVFGGDVVFSTLPAQVPLAVYFQYTPAADNDEFAVELLQDDKEIAKIGITVHSLVGNVATLILPSALVAFDKEVDFKVVGSLNKGPKFEILRKKIITGPVNAA